VRNLIIGIGMVLAVVISWSHWHSIVWAIIHGALGWIYVVYFVINHYQLL
jgi:hypothetical protein